MSIIDVEKMIGNQEECMVDYINRYDWVEFDYKGENYRGEVRRVLDKPKGKMMIVKIGLTEYRSCYLEQCENMIHVANTVEAGI
jgi:hypothetical protein